jgi:ATP-dependent helicase Lhr and Lhr-like helicase
MPHALDDWFSARGWQPFGYQRETWDRYLKGESGLVHAATGTGKTLAVYGGPLIEWLGEGASEEPPSIRILWITPLRALAADTEQALKEPLAELEFPWRVERRTGDTGYSVKKRQRERLPAVLVTTPESLSLLLSYPGSREQFADLRCVVVDEWHELLGSKRGTMIELALARLRGWAPAARFWGVSATLGNLEDARAALLGKSPGSIVEGVAPKEIVVDSILPENVERFSWAGHMGMSLLGPVIEAIEESAGTLVFVNTRRQAERWYQGLLESRPDWAGEIALHHGSLARATRRFVERGVKEGRLRAVVATSSLDLGVDFPPVDRVLQVGSPKGVGRLIQRAGRSGHQPGVPSRVTVVPTHVFELVEAEAAREAAHEGLIEPRAPLEKPLDLLAQHILTVALGEPFVEVELRDEVRSTHAYRDLTDDEWAWTLDFAASGGPSLRAYPEFQRMEEVAGRWTITTDAVARRHRMAVGVIVSEATIEIRYRRGPSLGSVPESFITKLEPGDSFYFGGKALELIRVREMRAYVRRARGTDVTLPAFLGGRMALSTELGAAVRRQLDLARTGRAASPEMEALSPIIDLQRRWSTLPRQDDLLIERTRTREGTHLFVYPFEGRLVHEGMAAVVALRMSRLQPISFSLSFTDYGFELLSAVEPPLEGPAAVDLFSVENLEEDISEALNTTEMAKRQFREIARVSGLVFPGFPGQGRSARHLQMSSGLIFEVFRKHDPENLLLEQARREVREQQLEIGRLRAALERIAHGQVVVVDTPRPTPLAFPILVERMRVKVSSQKLADRIRNMQLRLERAAG